VCLASRPPYLEFASYQQDSDTVRNRKTDRLFGVCVSACWASGPVCTKYNHSAVYLQTVISWPSFPCDCCVLSGSQLWMILTCSGCFLIVIETNLIRNNCKIAVPPPDHPSVRQIVLRLGYIVMTNMLLREVRRLWKLLKIISENRMWCPPWCFCFLSWISSITDRKMRGFKSCRWLLN